MTEFIHITNIDELAKFTAEFDSKEFAFDTEFTSLSWMEQNLIGMSIYDPKTLMPSAFIQFNFHDTYMLKEKDPNGGRKKVEVVYDYYKTDAIDFEDARPYLETIFKDAECITANGKVEWKIMSKYGITDWTIKDDTMIMAWMLDVDALKGLKPNAKKFLDLDMPSYEKTVGQKPGNINWNVVDWYAYAEYGAKDSYATYLLRDALFEKYEGLEPLYKCYQGLEIPLIYEVSRSEMAGVHIDVPFLLALSEKARKAIAKAEKEIYEKIGVEFNIGSSKQLAEMLFDRMGLKCTKRSEKTGARSVNEDVLKQLAFDGHYIAEDILDYRKLKKLKSTYIDAIPLMVDSDGRLRGSFNQAGTVTGRFSSSKPNLQNQPNSYDFPIKRAFIPKPGYKFLVYDWSTIEVRIMAHESGCPTMCKIFTEYRDIHQETTDNVNKQVGLNLNRGQGKTINFGVLYLMGAKSLAYMLNKQLRKEVKDGKIDMIQYKEQFVKDKTAQSIIDGFFGAYKGFANFVDAETQSVKQSGYSWTLGGRRRPVPELRRNGKGQWGIGKRKAVNTPIQGGAGDLMKLTILKLQRMFIEEEFDATTLLYVHDEVVIEVREDQAEKCAPRVQHVMETVFPACKVPILAEGGIYDDWAGLKQGASEIIEKLGAMKAIDMLKLGFI